jgi:heme/copper-type cytochrome/quinol oxidase subunit 2
MLESLSGMEFFLIFGTIAFIVIMPIVVFLWSYRKSKREVNES